MATPMPQSGSVRPGGCGGACPGAARTGGGGSRGTEPTADTQRPPPRDVDSGGDALSAAAPSTPNTSAGPGARGGRGRGARGRGGTGSAPAANATGADHAAVLRARDDIREVLGRHTDPTPESRDVKLSVLEHLIQLPLPILVGLHQVLDPASANTSPSMKAAGSMKPSSPLRQLRRRIILAALRQLRRRGTRPQTVRSRATGAMTTRLQSHHNKPLQSKHEGRSGAAGRSSSSWSPRVR
jgi:hypothetical protein